MDDASSSRLFPARVWCSNCVFGRLVKETKNHNEDAVVSSTMVANRRVWVGALICCCCCRDGWGHVVGLDPCMCNVVRSGCMQRSRCLFEGEGRELHRCCYSSKYIRNDVGAFCFVCCLLPWLALARKASWCEEEPNFGRSKKLFNEQYGSSGCA